MAKPEWGSKRQCRSCGTRFYDLNRESVACPKCDAAFEVAEAASRKPPSVTKPPPPPPPPKRDQADGDRVEDGADPGDGFELPSESRVHRADFIEDAADLDDDVSAVIDSKPGEAKRE